MNLRNLMAAVALLAFAASSHALEVKPYTAAALAQAQAANQPVALHFHADWCPTCLKQEKVLQSLKTEPGLDLTVLVADYDAEKALKRRFRVNVQSTLIVLHGQKEVTRLVGNTQADAIRGALKTAL
ncbi:MAG: thioredoxin family protein [Burkholderiales bacterium]|nr:thioredoxin family protein [Burkholderiales bacterium]